MLITSEAERQKETDNAEEAEEERELSTTTGAPAQEEEVAESDETKIMAKEEKPKIEKKQQ